MEMRAEAEELVAARRRKEVDVVAAIAKPRHAGVFEWVGGPPTAGLTATIAYNKACGPLR